MKIVIVGSWREENNYECENEAKEVGRLLALKGAVLVSGGGIGVSRLVVDSYRENGGEKYICYLPSKEEMKKVGDTIGPKPDEIIETNLDYPGRNLVMLKECDGVIALNGSLGALTELINAIIDYKKRVAVFDSGKLSIWINSIHQLKKKLLLTRDMEEVVNYFFE